MKGIVRNIMRVSFIAGVLAATTITCLAAVGVTNDAWDVNQGAVAIYSTSGQSLTNMEAIFGRLPGGVESAMFSDGAPTGYGHSIVWDTPAPIHLSGFILYAAGDTWYNGSSSGVNREFDIFRLYYLNTTLSTWNLIYTQNMPNPYSPLSSYTPLVYTGWVDVMAQRFMAEFTQLDASKLPNGTHLGPRVLELDAITYGQGTIAAHKTFTPPVIDGVYGDRCWDDTQDFALGSSPADTHCRVAFDDHYLYMLAVCNEPLTSQLVKNVTAHDGDMSGDDRVRYFISPSPYYPELNYYIDVNPLGTVTDGYIYPATYNWESGATVATSIGNPAGCWIAEMKIPLTSFYNVPWTSDTVGFNIIRDRKPMAQTTSWYSINAGIGSPQSMGQVLISGISSLSDVQQVCATNLTRREEEISGRISIMQPTLPANPVSSQMLTLKNWINSVSAAVGTGTLNSRAANASDFEHNVDAKTSDGVTHENVSGNFDLVAMSPLRKYRSTDIPVAGQSVSLSAAKGEAESAQFIVRAKAAVNGFSVTYQPLVGPGGFTIQPEVRLEDYVPVSVPCTVSYNIFGQYPDPLVNLTTFNLTANTSRGIWLDAWVPLNAPAGQYNGQVSVTAGGVTKSVSITLTVKNVTLPVTSYLKTYVWFLSSYKYPYITDDQANAFTALGLKYRFSSPPRLPWSTTLTKVNNVWTANWTDFDTKVQNWINAGVTSFWIDFIPWGDIMPTGTEKTDCEAKLALLSTHLRAKGWMNKFLAYFFDEAPPSAMVTIRQKCAWIHGIDTTYRIVNTVYYTTYSEGEGYTNVWVPTVSCYDKTYLDSRRALGEEGWYYECMGTGPTAYPDMWKIDWRATGPRANGWLLWNKKSDGFLYWGVDVFWGPIWQNPADFVGSNGDGFLFYPDKTYVPGYMPPVYPSMRVSTMRDGFEDYDLFKMLDIALTNHPEYLTQYGYLLDTASAFPTEGTYVDNPDLYEQRHTDVLNALQVIQ